MDLLLTTFAILAIVCVVAVVGGFFWVRALLIHKVDYHRAAAIHKFPQRLTIKQLEPFAWRKLSRGRQRVDSFRALGFEALGGFAIDEIPNARLFALQHPRSGLLGVVNEHECLGTWSDVLLFLHGESQPILASSILRHCHFFFLPGSPKIHKRDATEEELCNTLLLSAGNAPAQSKMTASEFAYHYEEAFARSVDQRLLEPLSDNEFRRLLREHAAPCCDEPINDKEFNRIKKQYPAAIANELRLACGGQFVRETTLPASQWQQVRGRLLVVHDLTPLGELRGRRIYGAHLTDTLKQRLGRLNGASSPRQTLTDTLKQRLGRLNGASSPRQTFADLNATLPAWQRYKKLGEVTRPVAADIYGPPTVQKMD